MGVELLKRHLGESELAQAALNRLEETLGVSFADSTLLSLALTHPSAPNEHPQAFSASNQRLEFLGDSFLDYVAARELYMRQPELAEGSLTELRSAVVRGEALARVARDISLGSYLLMGQGEESSGGRERDSNLAAAVEALVGAVLLDRGMDDAYAVTLRLLEPELDRVIRDGAPKDPKSRLQELMQGMGKGSPVYTTVAENGLGHERTFEIEVALDDGVVGRGSGRRKVDGEREAAIEALKALEENADVIPGERS